MEKTVINSSFANAMIRGIMIKEDYTTTDEVVLALIREHMDALPAVTANAIGAGLYTTQATD